jgi:hypothetical protein
MMVIHLLCDQVISAAPRRRRRRVVALATAYSYGKRDVREGKMQSQVILQVGHKEDRVANCKSSTSMTVLRVLTLLKSRSLSFQ